jgi:hypothetical protein
MRWRHNKLALLGLAWLVVSIFFGIQEAAAQQSAKPNIVIIWGDDIGQSNISAYTNGLMGYRTPNIDSIGQEGVLFTDYYGVLRQSLPSQRRGGAGTSRLSESRRDEQSCTAGRAAFITGQSMPWPSS